MPMFSENSGSTTSTLQPQQAVAGSLTISSGYTLGVPAIPANALRVRIKNMGSTIEVGGTPGANADITVGGQTVGVGQEVEYTAKLDPVTNAFKYLSNLVVTNPSGAGIWYEIES